MKDKICKLLGNNIKKYRKLRGYTQESLAEALGMEIKSLSLVETGRGFVSSNTLAKLSDVLGVAPAELFSGEDITNRYDDIQNALELIKNDSDKLNTIWVVLKSLI